jgi:hypothetical protein
MGHKGLGNCKLKIEKCKLQIGDGGARVNFEARDG